MIKLSLFALISLFLIIILQDIKKEYAFLIKISFIVIAVLYFQQDINKILTDVSSFFEGIGLDSHVLKMIIKTFCLCTLTQIIMNICIDCKETAMATIVELAGRFSILLLSMPLVKELFDFVTGWITS